MPRGSVVAVVFGAVATPDEGASASALVDSGTVEVR